MADYFLPRSAAPPAGGGPGGPRPERSAQRPAALPILAVPIGDRDVVRSAFAWNLVVELARLGASAVLVAPEEREPSPLWPEAGPGPLGTDVVLVPAAGLGDLHRAALDLAVCRAAEPCEGGVVVVRVPPDWIQQTRDGAPLLRWVLLFASPERRDLLEAYALVKRVRGLVSGARVGVTIHGVRRVGEAERAFRHVAGACDRHLGSSPLSYGLLVDDLHVYRAIVSRRPIGLEHPQSRAARALRDVAELVLGDAGVSASA